jgi:hypothetical protein
MADQTTSIGAMDSNAWGRFGSIPDGANGNVHATFARLYPTRLRTGGIRGCHVVLPNARSTGR